MTNSPGRFRVVAYNLYFGGVGRVDALHAVLASLSPDAAALTEADDPDVAADLAARLDMRHVWARGSGDRHVALLSRHSIASWRIFNRKPITQAILETRLEIPIPNYQLPLTLYTAHLLPYLLLPFEIRRAQALDALLRIIARDRPGPHLILGDLNAIAPGERVLQHKNPPRMRRVMALQANLIFRLAIPRLLRAGYLDCFRARHPLPRLARAAPAVEAEGFTWHTGNRTTRYDYIFADAALAPRLRACWALTDHPAVEAASDHYPVVADFELDSDIINAHSGPANEGIR